MNEFLKQLGSALLGGGAVATFIIWYIKSILTQAEDKRAKDLAIRQRRFAAEADWEHCLGRTVFWIVHGINAYEKDEGLSYWNGDLKESFDDMQKAENAMKEIDNEQLAKINEKK